MTWTNGTFEIITQQGRQARDGHTLGRALGVHKAPNCYILTDLYSGRRLTTTTRLKDAKALGLKLIELYDEQGQWLDLTHAKARISAILSTWERGSYAPGGDMLTTDEVALITRERKTASRDEHIVGAHAFTPTTPQAPCNTQDFLRWLSYRHNATVHHEPYRVTFRLGWIDYTMRIVTDPLAWPLWLEEVIPQLAQALGQSREDVLADIAEVKVLT